MDLGPHKTMAVERPKGTAEVREPRNRHRRDLGRCDARRVVLGDAEATHPHYPPPPIYRYPGSRDVIAATRHPSPTPPPSSSNGDVILAVKWTTPYLEHAFQL